MQVKDKVLVQFYEDNTDLIIFKTLSKITRRRNFSNKIKDMLLEHIRTTMPDIYNEVVKELNDTYNNTQK